MPKKTLKSIPSLFIRGTARNAYAKCIGVSVFARGYGKQLDLARQRPQPCTEISPVFDPRPFSDEIKGHREFPRRRTLLAHPYPAMIASAVGVDRQ